MPSSSPPSNASIQCLTTMMLARLTAARSRPVLSRSSRILTHHRSRLLAPLDRVNLCPPTIASRRALSSTIDGHHKPNAGEAVETERSLEEQYSRKTPLEHVLLRPGMYVGPNERLPPQSTWVLEPTPLRPTDEWLVNPWQTPVVNEQPYRMVQREYGLVPALVKIFDEILVNASDNRLRHPKSCTRIDVIIDPGSESRDPFIRVFNDGKGIPVQIHKKEDMLIPEMLFGHLLTGSNFDDNEKRLTGGRHGYGAKLTNIFSKSFTVETLDARRRLKYRQTWSNNMTEAAPYEIVTADPEASDYTCVSFVPDLPRLTGDPDALFIQPEDYAVMCRRVVDIAGCAAGKLQVSLNGVDLSLPSFEDYCQMYRGAEAPGVCFAKLNSRWTVGVGLSESGSFESVSFVNGMSTPRGGTHVNAIVNQVAKRLQERVEKLDPELAKMVTPGLIRRHLFVCCDALIENPSFDSQMKEYLTSSPHSFGSSCALSEKFLKQVSQSDEQGGPGIVDEILRIARGRQQASLLKEVGGKKTRRQLLSIPKLEDAHQAGSDKGYDCTLILTEGDSAKALAVAGLEVIGRSNFGVFPLRGKFLNVRDAAVSQLTNNGEVKALCSIVGLDFDKEYDTLAERRELRYGKVMLMTDQDTDGSHIKGLVINFFRHFWPKLLRPPVDLPPVFAQSFLSSFVTPLLKASKGKKETLAFYSMAEYQRWRSSIDDAELKNWSVKYYKGLGTSTPAEAKEYFSAFDKHVRPFHWNSEIDGEMIDMVFDKKRASERRDWLLDTYDETATVVVDPNDGNYVSYEDFINKEMIHFSQADNIRSIPSVVDGLKPSQRKVLYACFKRKLKAEIKVAQLTGYCAEHTAYHHGEASLQATIIGMAQDFVGSNNINLLVPSGQFGTRLEGGKDAASPRYIFTQLSPIARYLFPEIDDILLSYREDDGQTIEPEFFCPIIPLLLVNGTLGIGTGWSTSIPPHNPIDVLDYMRAKLDGKQDLPTIRPFARGFDGTIEWNKAGGGYVSIGRAKKASDKTVLIDELPLRMWTNQYKQTLLKMRDRGEIAGFVENHTTSKVSFTVEMKRAQLNRMVKSGLEKKFKLYANLPTTNMHAFGADGVMGKFETAEDIADAFFPIRFGLYQDRKSVLESEMKYAAEMMQNKARFIEAVTTGQLDLASGRKTKQETSSDLHKLGFATAQELKAIRNENDVYRRRQALLPDDEMPANESSSEFDYLLNMQLSSLTAERISDLRNEASKKQSELKSIESTSEADLWREDLEKLAPML